MKRLALFFPFLTLLALVVTLVPSINISHAQTGGDLIVLNDSTPGIDVVINPSPETTGVVGLEVENASVSVADAVGNIVFETADTAISALEFSFAPNAGTHTLTISRLPGAVQAYARMVAQAEMTVLDAAPELVSSNTLTLAQEADFPLNASAPSSVVAFTVSEANAVTVTALFPGAPVTAQLVDVADNSSVATLTGSLIDGVRLTMGSGDYQLVLLNNNTARETVANVSLVPAQVSDFDTLVAEAESAVTTTLVNTSPANADANSRAQVSACTLMLTASSANLHSGPGTGYSVLDYAFRGDALPVGGVNPGSGWFLVGTDTASGWVMGDVGTLSGTCENLTTYDIPYRDAPTPSVSIQQPQIPVYRDDDHDDDDYYEYDDNHDNSSHEDDHDEYEYEHEDEEHGD